ncbi:MAG: hypothetical protein QG606_617 [Patescibacteria group bacterium]|nr:hypothetical protein [Patescibacteria group bacterium]
MLQLFVTLLQIGLSITVGRYIFDASGKEEYCIMAMLLTLILLWMLELLWNIDNKLNRTLKREVPEVEE